MGEHVRRYVRNHGAARATKLFLFLVRRIGFMVPAHVHVVRSQMRKPFRTRFTAVLTRSVLWGLEGKKNSTDHQLKGLKNASFLSGTHHMVLVGIVIDESP